MKITNWLPVDCGGDTNYCLPLIPTNDRGCSEFPSAIIDPRILVSDYEQNINYDLKHKPPGSDLPVRFLTVTSNGLWYQIPLWAAA